MLIRLLGWVGVCAPLLFAFIKVRFSCDKAKIILHLYKEDFSHRSNTQKTLQVKNHKRLDISSESALFDLGKY